MASVWAPIRYAVAGHTAAVAFARINGWVVARPPDARCARLPESAERQT
ncbi:hypothetical protein ACFWAY_49500 [Rhodococcus sp. NPDC059968]